MCVALGVGLQRRVAVGAEQHALGERLGHRRAVQRVGHGVEQVDGQVRLALRGPGQRRRRPR